MEPPRGLEEIRRDIKMMNNKMVVLENSSRVLEKYLKSKVPRYVLKLLVLSNVPPSLKTNIS